MAEATRPQNERQRLEALQQCEILDTPPEPCFDELARLTSLICATPIALISLIDEDRQWFKACIGLGIRETPRELAFCAHTILQDDPLVIEDATHDPRTADNSLVTGPPHLRFYAGAPLRLPSGEVLGTLCVVDLEPRTLTSSQLDGLTVLARQVAAQLELRRLHRESKASETALRQSETLFRTLALHAPVGIFKTNPHGECVYVNGRWCELTGCSAEKARGDGWMKALHEDDQASVSAAWRAFAQGEAEFALEYRFKRSDGSVVWTMGRAVSLQDEAGGTAGYIGTIEDISDRKQAEDRLRVTATHDDLTGLPNRALLLDRIAQCVARHSRNPARHFAVLFLDFDRFKLVNDSLGHKAGDELLRQIAGRLRAVLRPADTVSTLVTDTAGRLGGDEFVVILDELADPSEARVVAERLLKSFQEPFDLDGHEIVSTASIGIVTSRNAAATAEEILRDADTAMYEAKARGRGRYVEFDEAMRTQVQTRLSLEQDLRHAVSDDRLWIAFQPIFSLETRTLEGIEALVRWNHPTRGPIEPTEFIPMAEEIGLVATIGERVLGAASRNLARWRQTFGEEALRYVSVNLSRFQLADPQLPDRLKAIAAEHGIPPRDVCLEITEEQVMNGRHDLRSALRSLRRRGFRLALDDFGTGLSSLSGLQELPLDLLKIDRAFVADLVEGRHFQALAHSIIELARNLNLKTVAEGVETRDQVVTLQTLNCQFAQGNYFAAPMSEEEITVLLEDPLLDDDVLAA